MVCNNTSDKFKNSITTNLLDSFSAVLLSSLQVLFAPFMKRSILLVISVQRKKMKFSPFLKECDDSEKFNFNYLKFLNCATDIAQRWDLHCLIIIQKALTWIFKPKAISRYYSKSAEVFYPWKKNTSDLLKLDVVNVVVMEWGKVEVDLGYIEENQIRCVMPNQTLKTTFPFPHLWRGAQIEHFVLGLRNEILIVTDNSLETWHAFFEVSLSKFKL